MYLSCVPARTQWQGAESFSKELEGGQWERDRHAFLLLHAGNSQQIRLRDLGLADSCLEGKGPFKHECLDLDGNSQREYSRELSRLLSKMGNYGTPCFQGENLCTLAPGRMFRKRLRQTKEMQREEARPEAQRLPCPKRRSQALLWKSVLKRGL